MAIDKLKSGALNLQDNVAVDTDTLFVDASADRVGIGTASPTQLLDIAHSGSQSAGAVRIGDPSSISSNTGIYMRTTGLATIGAAGGTIVFDTNFGSSEKVRIDSDGMKFNGDTAAANALDDYEEGTFNPTVSNHTGSTSGQAVGGVYVKVGKVCHFQGVLTQGSGSVIGTMELGGFPFTSAGTYGHISINTSASNQIQMSACRVVAGQTAFSIKAFDGTDVSSGSGAVNICFQGSFQVV